ncbi:MAG: BolA/IbaG family iron-sulfur metabolism protein [Oleiphilaceae bacterium]|nr:BolA/IbaG family iron-sulfur metabolism protein [Oleiphilaceae bacterium]
MQASEVKQLITDQLENVEVEVETDGYQYQVRAIGDVFDGLNAVKRQQLIYGCLNQYIIDGTIHAVVIKTYTPAEWQAQQ